MEGRAGLAGQSGTVVGQRGGGSVVCVSAALGPILSARARARYIYIYVQAVHMCYTLPNITSMYLHAGGVCGRYEANTYGGIL